MCVCECDFLVKFQYDSLNYYFFSHYIYHHHHSGKFLENLIFSNLKKIKHFLANKQTKNSNNQRFSLVHVINIQFKQIFSKFTNQKNNKKHFVIGNIQHVYYHTQTYHIHNHHHNKHCTAQKKNFTQSINSIQLSLEFIRISSEYGVNNLVNLHFFFLSIRSIFEKNQSIDRSIFFLSLSLSLSQVNILLIFFFTCKNYSRHHQKITNNFLFTSFITLKLVTNTALKILRF